VDDTARVVGFREEVLVEGEVGSEETGDLVVEKGLGDGTVLDESAEGLAVKVVGCKGKSVSGARMGRTGEGREKSERKRTLNEV
jgi:hypothetical protein